MRSQIELRVYYEDTDFSGRVYHASYLRFMERGRTEWLRERGYEHRQLQSQSDLVFAVRGLQIEYFAPALMDDWLTIETVFAGPKGALLVYAQKVLRGAKVLTEATVTVVTISGGKVIRPPKVLLARAVRGGA